MPISSGGSFDNTGASYNVSMILTEDKVFDEEKCVAFRSFAAAPIPTAAAVCVDEQLRDQCT